jgi:hypothetical protein
VAPLEAIMTDQEWARATVEQRLVWIRDQILKYKDQGEHLAAAVAELKREVAALKKQQRRGLAGAQPAVTAAEVPLCDLAPALPPPAGPADRMLRRFRGSARAEFRVRSGYFASRRHSPSWPPLRPVRPSR